MSTPEQFFEDRTWLLYAIKSTTTRKRIKDEIAARGGAVLKSVTKKLEFMVWDDPTRVPGDVIPASKASKLLAQGGVVFSVDDFDALLDGEVPPRVAAHLAAPAASAAPAPVKKKAPSKKKAAKKPKPLDEATLRDRCCAAFAHVSASDWRGLRTADAAIHVALDSGRIESAKVMAEALPERLRGLSRWRVAGREGQGLAEATRAALESTQQREGDVRQGSQSVPPGVVLAGRLMLSGDEELSAPAKNIVEEVFGGERPYDHLAVLVRELAHGGLEGEVSGILERWRVADLDSLLAFLQERSHGGGYLAYFCDRPEVALSLLEGIEERSRNDAIDRETLARVASSWTAPQIEAFMSGYYDNWSDLAEPMARAERSAEHARLTISALSDTSKERWKGFESSQLLALGQDARDAIRAYMNSGAARETDGVTWVSLKVRVGDSTIAQACAELAGQRQPDGLVMSTVLDLLLLVHNTLEWGVDADDYDPVWDEVERLFALSFRKSNDALVEHNRRTLRNDLRVKLLMREGDAAAVEAALKQDLSDLKSLHAYCNKTYARNTATGALIMRALEAGHPELALKAARKISKGDRPAYASRVAAGFVATDPAAALAAFDSLVGKDAHPRMIIRESWRVAPPLLMQLWNAVT